MDSLQGWCEGFKMIGNAGYVFHTKLKFLKDKIKVWVKENIGKVEQRISSLEGLLLGIECEEEERLLTEDEMFEKHQLTLELRRALKLKNLLWSKKARVEWILQWVDVLAFSQASINVQLSKQHREPCHRWKKGSLQSKHNVPC